MTAHHFLVQSMWEGAGEEGKEFSSSKATAEYC